jgi:membrane-associated protein
MFNVSGGILWISLFVFAGYYFGNIPAVEENFTLVIMAIILLSVLPAIIEYARHRLRTE